MANDWIKLIKGLEKKREVIAMAIALKPVGTFSLDCEVIAYKWAKVWSWADSETVDGHISGLNGSVVDDIAGLPGFFAAAEVAGWARSTDRGISFTNWDRHNGNGAKARALAANRQQSRRDQSAVTQPSRAERDKSVTRAEQQRAEKSREETKQQADPIPIEDSFPHPAPPPLSAAAGIAHGEVCSLLLAVTFQGVRVFDPSAASAVAAGRKASKCQVAWALERFAEERATEAGRARLRNPAGYIRGLIERHEPPAGWVEKFNRAEIRRIAQGAA